MEEKYFVHPSSFVDEDVEIGEGTKIWHFCHIQKGARIGKGCSLGQNVNVSNHVMSPCTRGWSWRTMCSAAPPACLPTT